MNYAVELNNVTAGYKEKIILNNISIAIQEGKIAGVIGPNGAGKTTLLKVITGLLKQWTGEIRIFGKPINKIRALERACLMGVVPASVTTPMNFTVGEIVSLGRIGTMPRWKPVSQEDKQIIERAMAYTGITDFHDQLYSELSAGEKQRVIIAMVLAQQPRIILMDEATSHLDINHKLEIMSIIERLNTEHNVTVLMISHDLNLAADYCQNLFLFNNGNVFAKGKPHEVMTENNLREVYGCNVSVRTDPVSGTITVMPARRWMPHLSGAGFTIHVIGGGGCAEELIRRLVLCGYTVTCGVLNQGDSDAILSSALGIKTILEKPFSPIRTESLSKAVSLALKADAVVVSVVPFGSGNLANLEIAKEALKIGKKVFIKDKIENRDYTEGKQASKIAAELINRGAILWNNMAELFSLLPSKQAENKQ